MNAIGRKDADDTAEESFKILIVWAEAVFYGANYELTQLLPYGLIDIVDALKGMTNGMLY